MSSKITRINDKISMILIGLGCIGLGLAVIFIALSQIKAGKESESWPSVRGRIVESKVRSRRTEYTDRDTGVRKTRTEYFPHVVYEYEVDSEVYKGSRICFGCVDAKEETAYRLVRMYPKGREVDVYYDPEKPSRSVLQPGEDLEMREAMIGGIVFVAAGILVLFGVLTGRLKVRYY